MGLVSIRAVWEDADLLEIMISVRSDTFAAQAVIYSGTDLLLAAAASVIGFPQSSSDRRSFNLAAGKTDLAFFELKCIDGAGHALLIATIRDRSGIACQEATIAFPVFPVALDAFGAALKAMAARTADEAVLQD